MKRLSVVLIFILLLPIGVVLSPANAGETVLIINPLKEVINAVPGETVTIPFQIKNLGNDTLRNVTVYVTGPAEGFIYQTKLIRVPVPPNGTLNESLSIKVLLISAGVYNLTIVARAGSVYTQAPVKIRVGILSDYSIDVEVGKEYLYGHDVGIRLIVKSKSNGVLLGTVGYSISRDGVRLIENENSTYIQAGGQWERNITLHRPEIGNYTVALWANLGGKFKKVTKTFRVYQRKLSYRAFFRNGAITVIVYNSSGGVPGIKVTINGVEFTTDESGKVSYAVDTPGTYEVVLDLDGKIVTTFVEVKRLFISYQQRNSTLIVKVVDSTGLPVPNVTLSASGPLGKDYAVTNSSGLATVNLNKTGYGTLIVSAQSDDYIGAQAVLQAVRPVRPSPTTSSTTKSETISNQTYAIPPSTTGEEKTGNDLTALILIASGLILAGTSYLAFATPSFHEETLDRYYFAKVKAPRLRPLHYHFERPVSAREVRVTKGKARIEDGRIIWEVELEPGEEAQLQAVLG
ncbi:hypothetical protein [Thermococcus sp.]|uniref:COG1470 family protein n=1 Tax=Thermococcus sp. TaxID=35749 RepID=UPI00260DA602|nr:hypothetical protein [Thermococcus sp.]